MLCHFLCYCVPRQNIMEEPNILLHRYAMAFEGFCTPSVSIQHNHVYACVYTIQTLLLLIKWCRHQFEVSVYIHTHLTVYSLRTVLWVTRAQYVWSTNGRKVLFIMILFCTCLVNPLSLFMVDV